jgi:glyoxylase-like metal-dependent hydrolase (beta-lactamase superfamily II)
MAIDATRTHMPALPQVETLGFRREDVRHIVLTHLDFEHAGGLPDFPHAKVHVHAREKDAASARGTFNQKQRYRSVQFAHSPVRETYETLGEPWKGMPAVRQLAELPAEILALPFGGHSRGHAAIAVDTGHGWLVHAGDAYFPPQRDGARRDFRDALGFAARRAVDCVRLQAFAREPRDAREAGDA